MSPFTTVFLVAACAALLVGSDARQHGKRVKHVRSHRRNANDASVALGNVGGSEVRALPDLQINLSDVILGVPDVCDEENRDLEGTLVVVSNTNQGSAPELNVNNKDDPQSNFLIHCVPEDDGSQCTGGVTVKVYQFCSDVRTTTTTPSSTSSEGN